MANTVRLHFRSLSLTQQPFSRQLANAQRVYGRYGINIQFASGVSLGLSDAEARRFERLDGSCNWVIDSGEYKELLQMAHDVPRNDIAVFYVSRFSSATLLGCGGHIPGEPACIVASRSSSWDMAHEVGHVLLGRHFPEVHNSSRQNLMFEYSQEFRNTPNLTQDQVDQMKRSPCCR